MRCIFYVNDLPPEEREQVNKILPDFMEFEEINGESVIIAVKEKVSVDQMRYFVERELNRISFLAGYEAEIKKETIETGQGKTSYISSNFDAIIIKKLTPDIGKQVWDESTPIQLSLWKKANKLSDKPIEQIKLLFQIIEKEYPKTNDANNYPEFTNSNNPPAPLTECKLLRDLVSHQKHKVDSKQLKLYCEHIGYPNIFFDPTDPNYEKAIWSKLPLMKTEARKIIESKITKI